MCKKCLHILSRYSIILKNVYYSYHIPRLPKHIFQIQFPHNNIWQSLEIEFLSSHDSSYNMNIEWWTLDIEIYDVNLQEKTFLHYSHITAGLRSLVYLQNDLGLPLHFLGICVKWDKFLKNQPVCRSEYLKEKFIGCENSPYHRCDFFK